ncbi:TIR domain-containing protein [bacterium]|nr:TIR domain-containing protein [bacterium]
MLHRHKVFVSFHHGDELDPYSGVNYKNHFVRLFHDYTDTIISKAVQEGDIDPNLKTETIRAKIRDEYLRDSSVTVVLIGPETWKRKHVDWEISSSIRHTEYNPRSGLLGIFLPTHPDYGRNFNPYTIPPRLYDNYKCEYATLYDWNEDPYIVNAWIHEAFLRRKRVSPDDSFPHFIYNRSGDKWQY